jgi:hypothetical protein
MPSACQRTLLSAAALVACAAVAACDGGARAPDAQAQASTTSAELSVRFEVSANKPATVSVLGFRAVAAGPAGAEGLDVLGLVDPLAATAPSEGCVLRDVDLAASALGAGGGSVDLQELGGVGVGLGGGEAPGATLVRTFPRVYPDVGGIVGGVVGEAGPQPLSSLPDHVSLYSPDSELAIGELPVPQLPRLLAVNGSAPAPGARVDVAGGLNLSLASPAGAVVELRPFGATVAVICAVPQNASTEALVTVPPALLSHLLSAGPSEGPAPPAKSATELSSAALTRSAGAVGMSIEVARRTRLRLPLATSVTRVSVETRSALAVELRP